MRIIGGTHRRRLILAPKDEAITRPITDRVKTTLFDRLTAMAVLEGNVLDIFSGTGSLGLEALSRGVDHVTFIEKDRDARSLLERNLAEFGFEERATVLGVDALSPAWMHLLPRKPINLVFLDPPYRMTNDEKDMARMAGVVERLTDVMQPGGVLCLRSEAAVAAPAVAGWEGPVAHAYGSMALHFYQTPGAEEQRLEPEERD